MDDQHTVSKRERGKKNLKEINKKANFIIDRRKNGADASILGPWNVLFILFIHTNLGEKNL